MNSAKAQGLEIPSNRARHRGRAASRGLPVALALSLVVAWAPHAESQPIGDAPDAPLVTEEPDAGLPVSVDAGAPIVDTARPHSPPAPAAPAPSGDKAPTLTGTWSLEIDQDGRGFSPHVEGSRAILYQRGTRVVGEELVGSRLIASFDGVLEPARLRGTYTEAGVKTWIDSPYLIIVENQGRRVIMTLSHALKSGPLRLRLRSIDPLAAPSP